MTVPRDGVLAAQAALGDSDGAQGLVVETAWLWERYDACVRANTEASDIDGKIGLLRGAGVPLVDMAVVTEQLPGWEAPHPSVLVRDRIGVWVLRHDVLLPDRVRSHPAFAATGESLQP